MAITTAGLTELCLLMGAQSATGWTYLATGSGTTAFSAAQTALVSENAGTLARAADASPTCAAGTLTLNYTWTAGASFDIKEVGIFNASSGGDMLARQVLTVAKALVSGESYALTYAVTLA